MNANLIYFLSTLFISSLLIVIVKLSEGNNCTGAVGFDFWCNFWCVWSFCSFCHGLCNTRVLFWIVLCDYGKQWTGPVVDLTPGGGVQILESRLWLVDLNEETKDKDDFSQCRPSFVACCCQVFWSGIHRDLSFSSSGFPFFFHC